MILSKLQRKKNWNLQNRIKQRLDIGKQFCEKNLRVSTKLNIRRERSQSEIKTKENTITECECECKERPKAKNKLYWTDEYKI